MIAPFPEVAFLRIEPLNGGWVLLCGENDLVQIFRSGAEAERCARRYAASLARCGYAPRLTIRDRGDRTTKADI
ncbi:MAG: hypothetical protein J7515_17040 [Caulobacter sp.]|nr:hypothetical protein [Caulobacter sp.]